MDGNFFDRRVVDYPMSDSDDSDIEKIGANRQVAEQNNGTDCILERSTGENAQSNNHENQSGNENDANSPKSPIDGFSFDDDGTGGNEIGSKQKKNIDSHDSFHDDFDIVGEKNLSFSSAHELYKSQRDRDNASDISQLRKSMGEDLDLSLLSPSKVDRKVILDEMQRKRKRNNYKLTSLNHFVRMGKIVSDGIKECQREQIAHDMRIENIKSKLKPLKERLATAIDANERLIAACYKNTSLAIHCVRDLSNSGGTVASLRAQIAHQENALFRELNSEQRTFDGKLKKCWMPIYDKVKEVQNEYDQKKLEFETELHPYKMFLNAITATNAKGEAKDIRFGYGKQKENGGNQPQASGVSLNEEQEESQLFESTLYGGSEDKNIDG